VRGLFDDSQGVSFNLGVVLDLYPQDVPDPEHPRYAAHALITGVLELGKKPKSRAQRGLAAYAARRCVYMPPGIDIATS
jgi:hypothetical protein